MRCFLLALVALAGPTPEDFTVFEWNANIAEIWDQAPKTFSQVAATRTCALQFLTVIEGKEDRDMRLFNQGAKSLPGCAIMS